MKPGVLFVRQRLLSIFKHLNPGDVRITHHWTGTKFKVHSFKHKGYWFHGAGRERSSILLALRILSPGQTVIDVGANIGYLTELFAEFVGEEGTVHAFEPDPRNLRYLTSNVGTRPNVEIHPIAASDKAGTSTLYTESLTGQNSSLVADYEIFSNNQQAAGVKVNVSACPIEVTTLDRHLGKSTNTDFIKIDVEGFELEVLRGASGIISRDRPWIMVEVSRSHDEVTAFLRHCGYRLFLSDLTEVETLPGISNIFAFHREHHGELLSSLGVAG